jgi:Carboxypeptidase regulatory-like domain/TonB dependent receptor-like, beta-barrel
MNHKRLMTALSLFCFAIVLLVPHVAWTQAVGTIVGSVTDPSGAVIAQAKVTATNVATGVSQFTMTTTAGTYAIPNLPVGTYTITAEAPSFAPATITGVTLDVSQQREVGFKLTVRGINQSVEVNTAAPLVNTTDGSLAGLVDEKQVANLPLNGRSIQNLVMMQPGMAQDTGNMGWLAPQWISNGNRGETEQATLDGADASDSEMGTIQFWNFNLDAIAEFKVQQNNYSAEYGHGAGTITQIVSKSGTNDFHGSVFEFIRNSVFDAKNYFSQVPPFVPPFQRNEFGVTFGGPIRKNKTFFFVQYAGFRQRLGEPTNMLVPTSAERLGTVTVTDPHSGQPDMLQVPLNAVAQQVLNLYPLPNQPNGVFGVNTYNFQFKQPTNDDQFSVRLDEHISDRDSLFVRASYINNYQKETDPVAAVENPSFSSENLNNPRNYTINETHVFTPTLVNSFTFTLNRQIEGSLPPSQALTQTTFLDGTLANYGPDTFITKYVETNFIPDDNLSWTKGRNLFSIGGTFRRGWDNGFGVTGLGPNGQFQFNAGTPLTEDIPSTNGQQPYGPSQTGIYTASPNGLVAMMAGDDAQYGRATTIPGFGPPGGGGVHWGLRTWHIATYFQDDMKVTQKLTLNLGARYEYHAVPWEIGSRLGGIVDQGPLLGHFVLNPRPLYPSDYGNLVPRFGIAYKALNKTVIRGGVGIFTNVIPTVYPDQAAVNFPLASLSFLSNATYSLTPLPVSLPPLTSTSGQVMPPSGGTNQIPPNTPVNLAPIAAQIGAISGDYPSDQLKNGYTVTSNFTIEQELPWNVVLETSYVGNKGVNLYNSGYPNSYNAVSGVAPQLEAYTQITPGLGEVQLIYNKGTSNYNALQVQARKISPTHGLQFQGGYTWGKILTDADAVWSVGGQYGAGGQSGGISLNNPQCIKCEYGPASYSVGQRFVGNFTYNVPLSGLPLPSRLSKGWQLMGIFSAQSGFPFTVAGPLGTVQYGFDNLNGIGARPFLLEKPTKNSGGGPQFFSNAVLSNPGQFFSTPTTQVPIPCTTPPCPNPPPTVTLQTVPGDLGRNTFVGPSWWNFDFSLVKDTQLTESKMLQFRAEFFNLFNHSTFATPGGTLTSGNFGLSTNTATAERQIQFGARFVF